MLFSFVRQFDTASGRLVPDNSIDNLAKKYEKDIAENMKAGELPNKQRKVSVHI